MISARNAPHDVIEAIKDYETAEVSPSLLLYVEGQLQIPRVETVNWGWGDGLSQVLNATVAGRLPTTEFSGSQVVVRTEIAGWEQEMFVSKKQRIEHPQDTWKTNMIAATAGGYSSGWKLEQDVELTAWPPQAVARYAAAKLPYDQSDVRIHPFDSPLMTRTSPDEDDPEDLSFDETEPIQAMFDVVDGEVLCIGFDSSRGLRYIPDPGLGGGSDPEWEFRRNSPEIISWPAPVELDPDSQYSQVIVLAKHENGDDRIRVVHPVDNTGRKNPPSKAAILYLSWSDTSVESPEKAAKYGRQEADRLSAGLHGGTATVVYNPFIFPGRVVQFEETYRDDAGTWQRVWLCVVQRDVKHDDQHGKMSTQFRYQATKTFEELVEVPALILMGMTAPILSSPVTRVSPRYYAWAGYDLEGFWLDPTKVGWMGRDLDGFYIATGTVDDGGAGPYAGRDDDGFFVVTNKKFTSWGQTDVTFADLNTPFSDLA